MSREAAVHQLGLFLVMLLLTGCTWGPWQQTEESKQPSPYQGIITHGNLTVRLLEVSQRRQFITIKESDGPMRGVVLPGVTVRLLVEQQAGPRVARWNSPSFKFFTREGKLLQEAVRTGGSHHPLTVPQGVFEWSENCPSPPGDQDLPPRDPARSLLVSQWIPGLVLPAESFHMHVQFHAGDDPQKGFEFRDIPPLPLPR